MTRDEIKALLSDAKDTSEKINILRIIARDNVDEIRRKKNLPPFKWPPFKVRQF